MKTQNNAQKAINNLKFFSTSISCEVKNPLLAIKSICQNVVDNLEEMKESIYSIFDSSNRALLDIEIAWQNANCDKIDKSKFTNLSIATVVDNAVAKYFFEKGEIDLLNIDLSNDFIFKGDENLMSFVILNLLKNSLACKAKINIWIDADKNSVYFKDERIGIKADKLKDIFSEDKSDLQNQTSAEIGLSFCKKVMQAFGGDISYKSQEGDGTEFCLRF